MSRARDEFNNAPADGGRRESDVIQDGTYNFRVVALFVNQKDETHYGKAGLEVVDGLARGKYIENFDAIEGYGAQWFRKFLTIASGRSSDNLPKWADVWDEDSGRTGPIRKEVLGAVVECRVETKRGRDRDFVNIYVNRLVKPAGSRDERPADDRQQEQRDERRQPEPPAEPEPPKQATYHYWSKGGGQAEGLTVDQVADAIRKNPSDTHKVWQKGWEGWRVAADVEEIDLVLTATKDVSKPPPLPQPGNPPPPNPDTEVPYSTDDDIPF